ncbi:MAG: hypothetical protein KDB90_09975 [Planctomycetes bacterium]|nr:hypothetical protein [Planctomycetota bacterium]
MTTARAFAIALALALTTPVAAQGFDADGFFGDSFHAEPDRTDAGTLSAKLIDTPDWMDFTGSGTGRVRGHFDFDEAGMAVGPSEAQPSCEALLDVGFTSASGTLKLADLEQGGKFALHLRDMLDPAAAWLLEVSHTADGWQLCIRTRTPRRFVAMPGSKQQLDKLALPAELAFTIKDGLLSISIGGVESAANVALKNGLTMGLSFTDKRARVRDLSMSVKLDATWMQDAGQRLLARRTLERLRDYATVGLLSGISAYRHPGIEEALKAYSDEEVRQRAGMGDDIARRAEVTQRIAAMHPQLAAAQHEAGIAALVAGRLDAGRAFLQAADKLTRTPVTSLALAEADRRVGEIDAAEAQLKLARVDMPEALKPDFALVKARLAADHGDIRGAQQVLAAAHRDYPNHVQIAEFADSASALLQPPTLQATELDGPFGLRLVSDLDDDSLRVILARLQPYTEKIRLWLPDMSEKLDEGVLAIFSSPIEYLHAALLVAGDNLDNVAGMYLPHGIGGARSVLACRAFGEDELQRTLVHELWHMCVASTGRTETMPRWLNEGMAVFLSAGRQDSEGRMVYDELPSEFFTFGDAPLGVLTPAHIRQAVDARPAEFYVPGVVRGNYLASWTIVWFYASSVENLAIVRAILKGDANALKQATANEKALFDAATAALRKAGIE